MVPDSQSRPWPSCCFPLPEAACSPLCLPLKGQCCSSRCPMAGATLSFHSVLPSTWQDSTPTAGRLEPQDTGLLADPLPISVPPPLDLQTKIAWSQMTQKREPPKPPGAPASAPSHVGQGCEDRGYFVTLTRVHRRLKTEARSSRGLGCPKTAHLLYASLSPEAMSWPRVGVS